MELEPQIDENLVFATDKEVSSLMSSTASSTNLECSVCKMRFSNGVSLKHHQTFYIPKLQYYCQHCNVTLKFPSYCKINQHNRNHHINSVLRCNHKTEQIVLEKNCFKCTNCNAKLCCECNKTIISSLQVHFTNSVEGTTFSCTKSYCNLFFLSQCALEAHARLHSGSPPHVCPDCGYITSDLTQLIDHMMNVCYHVYKTIRYSCSGCPSTLFFNHSDYMRHLVKHIWTIYKCDLCSFFCTEYDQMTDHRFQLHDTEDMKGVRKCARCEFCPGKCFPTANEHVKLHQDSSSVRFVLNCSCYNTFETTSAFESHKKNCNLRTVLPDSWSCLAKHVKSQSEASTKTPAACDEVVPTSEIKDDVVEDVVLEGDDDEEGVSEIDEEQDVIETEQKPVANKTPQQLPVIVNSVQVTKSLTDNSPIVLRTTPKLFTTSTPTKYKTHVLVNTSELGSADSIRCPVCPFRMFSKGNKFAMMAQHFKIFHQRVLLDRGDGNVNFYVVPEDEDEGCNGRRKEFVINAPGAGGDEVVEGDKEKEMSVVKDTTEPVTPGDVVGNQSQDIVVVEVKKDRKRPFNGSLLKKKLLSSGETTLNENKPVDEIDLSEIEKTPEESGEQNNVNDQDGSNPIVHENNKRGEVVLDDVDVEQTDVTETDVEQTDVTETRLSEITDNIVQPVKNNVQPAKNNVEPAKNNFQPVKNNVQSVKNNVEPAKNNFQPVKNNVEPAKNYVEPTKSDVQVTGNNVVDTNDKVLENNVQTIDSIVTTTETNSQVVINDDKSPGSNVEEAVSNTNKECFKFVDKQTSPRVQIVVGKLNENAKMNSKNVGQRIHDENCICEVVLTKRGRKRRTWDKGCNTCDYIKPEEPVVEEEQRQEQTSQNVQLEQPVYQLGELKQAKRFCFIGVSGDSNGNRNTNGNTPRIMPSNNVFNLVHTVIPGIMKIHSVSKEAQFITSPVTLTKLSPIIPQSVVSEEKQCDLRPSPGSQPEVKTTPVTKTKASASSKEESAEENAKSSRKYNKRVYVSSEPATKVPEREIWDKLYSDLQKAENVKKVEVLESETPKPLVTDGKRPLKKPRRYTFESFESDSEKSEQPEQPEPEKPEKELDKKQFLLSQLNDMKNVDVLYDMLVNKKMLTLEKPSAVVLPAEEKPVEHDRKLSVDSTSSDDKPLLEKMQTSSKKKVDKEYRSRPKKKWTSRKRNRDDQVVNFIEKNFKTDSESSDTQVTKRRRKLSSRLLFNKKLEEKEDAFSSGQVVLGKTETQHECALCKQKYENVDQFHEHVKIHRSDENTFQCMECGQCFVVKPSLEKHLVVFHKIEDLPNYFLQNDCFKIVPEPVLEPLKDNQCEVCRDEFSSAAELSKHFRVHGMAFLKRRTNSLG